MVVWFYSYLYKYLWDIGTITTAPVFWYVATCVLGAVLLSYQFRRIHINTSVKRLFVWSIATGVVAVFSYIGASGNISEEVSLQALISLIEFLVLTGIFALLFSHREIDPTIVFCLCLVVLFSTASNVAEWLQIIHYDLARVFGRSAGFYQNSNISGNFIVLGAAIAAFGLPTKFRIPLLLLVLAGVATTFSRSSVLLWVIVFIFVSWNSGVRSSRAASALFASGTVLALGAMLTGGALIQYADELGLEQLMDENTTSRISEGFFNQRDDSASERMNLLELGTKSFLEHPGLGHGIGTSSLMGLHNHYLDMAVDYGIVGLALVFWFVWILWKTNTQIGRLSAMLFATASLFMHGLFESPAMAIFLAYGLAARATQTKQTQATLAPDYPRYAHSSLKKLS